MAAITIGSDFGAQENTEHLIHRKEELRTGPEIVNSPHPNFTEFLRIENTCFIA